MTGEEAAGGTKLVFSVGVRVGLTCNVDRQRGFVNGALGVILHVLRKDVIIARAILVHPVSVDRAKSMPASYAYKLPGPGQTTPHQISCPISNFYFAMYVYLTT